jgi:spectinomycin phosphotransferase/16S rRNA (guanine(1405)-N(7))-methyltransferase
MRTPPADLSDAAVLAELAGDWDLQIDSIVYAPVGFGSHHWRARGGGVEWFVTADDLGMKLQVAHEPRDRAFDRLQAALLTARGLRDAGLDFVVAPIPTVMGDVVRRVTDRYALAIYPYLDGRTRPWGQYESAADRRAILALVVALHGATSRVSTVTRTDDYGIGLRDELERALGDLGSTWDAGPYASAARDLLGRHARRVERLLARHDRLAAQARGRPERLVITHGEPHPGNAVQTGAGWALVDWDTALLAPPERDVWILAEGDESVVDAYQAATGRAVLADMLEFYRLTWHLADVAIYVHQFRRPHERSADVDKAWASLDRSLDLLAGWSTIP